MMIRRITLALALALMSMGICNRPAAMTFKINSISQGYVIEANGPIEQGDRVKLVTALDQLPIGANVLAFVIRSPGGNIFEAEKLATTVRSSGLAVLVPGESVCASACFLVFAAASHRYAFATSLIGVHSASENGQETLNSMGFTTALARDASGYGIPAAIIGKMVTTAPGQITWLTSADLALLGTSIVSVTPETAQAPSSPSSSHTTPSVSAAVESSAIQTTEAFEQGLADRRAIEAWINALTPDEQAGAKFWAAQRSLRKPGSCASPPTPDVADVSVWSQGCVAAQARFAPADARRKSELNYRAGWNSF